jgi:Tfp pilus assembly protein PilF/O-antigen ligase
VTLLVKLMLTVLILDPRSVDTFSLPKSVVAHGTSLVLAALLVWLLARYGRRLLTWSPAHLAAAALLLAFALATPFALDPTVALYGAYRRYVGLTQMLDNVLLYVSVGVLFRDLRSLRLLAIVVFGTAIPVLLYALVQILGLDPLTFTASTRIPITTIGNPDIAGAYLAMIGISALGVAFLLAGRLPRVYLLALGAIGVASVAGSYTTGVRGGLLALAGGITAIAALTFVMPSSSLGRRRIGVLAVGVLIAFAVLFSPVGSRIRLTSFGSDPAVLSRFELWETAGKAVAARPLLGIGPDNLVAFYQGNRAERSIAINRGEQQNSTHDVWLYIATSSGLAGLAAFIALVALLVERAVRMARRGELGALALIPLLAYLGQSLVGVNEVVVDWVFWLSAGVIAASGAEAVRRPRAGWPAPRGARIVGAAALAVAIALIVVTLPPRIAAGEAILATDSFNAANRAPEAISFGQDAVAADRRRAETWSSYGVALTSANRFSAAIAAFDAAAARQPWQSLNWRNLAIVWSQLGNRTSAIAAAERAIRVDQYDGEAHDIVATLVYDAGDYARAATEGELALRYRVAPEVSTYFTAVSAFVQLKDLAKAETLSQEAVKAFPTSARLRLQLAAILLDRGDKAGALAQVDRVLADDSTNTDAKALRTAIFAK